jgi:hypothetical protein
MARRRRKPLYMQSGIRIDRKDHSVCRVKFVDGRNHLQSTTVRIPAEVPLNNRNLVRLIENKTKHRVASIFSEECTTARRSHSHRLPRMPK